MFYHLFFETLIFYFFVSIFYRELFLSVTGFYVYKYQGKRAIFLSMGFIVLFAFFGAMFIQTHGGWNAPISSDTFVHRNQPLAAMA